MADIFRKEKKNVFFQKKNSLNQNLKKSLICAIAIVVKNMW